MIAQDAVWVRWGPRTRCTACSILQRWRFRAVFVTEPHSPSSTGGKGLGEAPVMGPTAAIANAIFNTTGARLRHAPFTPERVLAALKTTRGQRPTTETAARR